MIPIHIQYQGQLRSQATHGPSSVQLITDAPVDNQGKGESFSPTDLVATALGTCIATILGIKAQQKNLDLTGMTIDIEKHMSTDSPRRIARLPITIRIPHPPDHPERPLLEAVVNACPVAQSIHPQIEKPVSWHWQSQPTA
jgi:putative redox protein